MRSAASATSARRRPSISTRRPATTSEWVIQFGYVVLFPAHRRRWARHLERVVQLGRAARGRRAERAQYLCRIMRLLRARHRDLAAAAVRPRLTALLVLLEAERSPPTRWRCSSGRCISAAAHGEEGGGCPSASEGGGRPRTTSGGARRRQGRPRPFILVSIRRDPPRVCRDRPDPGRAAASGRACAPGRRTLRARRAEAIIDASAPRPDRARASRDHVVGDGAMRGHARRERSSFFAQPGAIANWHR